MNDLFILCIVAKLAVFHHCEHVFFTMSIIVQFLPVTLKWHNNSDRTTAKFQNTPKSK